MSEKLPEGVRQITDDKEIARLNAIEKPKNIYWEHVLVKGYDAEKKVVVLQNPTLGVSVFDDIEDMGTTYKIRFSDVPDNFWGLIDRHLGGMVRLNTYEYPKKKWYHRTPKRYKLIFEFLDIEFWSDMEK